jgi:hypothetical protein
MFVCKCEFECKSTVCGFPDVIKWNVSFKFFVW